MKLTNSKKEKADTQLRGCQFFSSRQKSSLSARRDSRHLLKKNLTQKRVQVSIFYIFRVQKLCSLRLVLEIESPLQDIF